MLAKENSQYSLFSFSNFIAAFGGGMILGKGIGIINTPFLKGGSVLAFFVGIVVGLLFLQLIPKKISKQLSQQFSIFGGITSFVLLTIFIHYAPLGTLDGDAALAFFGLLSVRFAFWFYSRALRAAAVANQKQSIAWVEIGYYAGTVLGLIIWSIPGMHLGFANALLVDAFLQFFAGFIDIYANRLAATSMQASNDPPIARAPLRGTSEEKNWCLRLIVSLVALTIGTQAIIFGLTLQVAKNLTSIVMAAFYIGVFIAALICKKNKISLEWQSSKTKKLSYAIICASQNNSKKTMGFFSVSLITCACVFISICATRYSFADTAMKMFFLLIFVALSAYFYEILALAILDRIGVEERLANRSGMIIKSYGFMGIGSAIGLWILTIIKNSELELFAILGCAFLVSVGVINIRSWPRGLSAGSKDL